MTGSVAVLGAGMAGLTAAWLLQQRGIEVVCYGAGAVPGGVVQSSQEAGYCYEHGPNTVLASAAHLGRLITELGLETELVVSAPTAKDRFIFREGRCHRLPTGPKDLLATTALSAGGKLALLGEPWRRSPQLRDAEETVAQFVERRLGREVLDYLVDPFISGIYAGDPAELEVASAFPSLVELERAHGSLLRGALARRKSKKTAPFRKGLLSFAEGLGHLPLHVAEQLGPALWLDCPVTELTPVGAGWRVGSGRGAMEFERVISALPAYALAELVAATAGELAGELRAIPYAGIVVVQLGFPLDAFRREPQGFGVLIPRNQGIALLGALFASSIFPGRAPADHVLLTCFIGGSRNPGILTEPDDVVVGQVVADLGRVLGVQGQPSFVRVIRWPRAIPQFVRGHGARRERIQGHLAGLPGLQVAGNWLDGISLDATVGSAYDASVATL